MVVLGRARVKKGFHLPKSHAATSGQCPDRYSEAMRPAHRRRSSYSVSKGDAMRGLARISALATTSAMLLLSGRPGLGAEHSPAPEPGVVRAAIDRALDLPDESGSWRLLVECRRDGQLPSLVVHGRGLGIWDGRRQFELSPGALRSLLVALRDGGLAEMAPSYGGRPAPARAPNPEDLSAIQVTCRIQFTLLELTKQVVQLEEGEQSPELARLADALYTIAVPAANTGIEAASLEDGLAKIARGELAPETLSAMLHRKPELLTGTGENSGFLLRIEGRTATVQGFTSGAGYGPARELELAEGELGELAAVLGAHRPSRLPGNLWAPDYNDLSLAVLNHRVALQARRFTGMTPTTHGEAQADFDAIAETLARLHEKVLRDGAPDAEE